MNIDDQIRTLQTTITALRAMHRELVDDHSLRETIPVAGGADIEVNSPALHLQAAIRQLQVARAALARTRPSRTVDGAAIRFTCDDGIAR